jgi:hypothetical protein
MTIPLRPTLMDGLGVASRAPQSRDGGRSYFTRMLLTDLFYPGSISFEIEGAVL